MWLAVTGLSRSGKTVFITSLIHNLLSALHNPNRMPLLDMVGERRLTRGHPGNRQCASVAAVSLLQQYRGDGGTRAGLADPHD